MRWHYWRERLEKNRQRPTPQPIEAPRLGPGAHAKVLRSLQKFQLGESGEGKVANQIDHVDWPGLDADLRALVKLWVKEEGRHARILGFMVRGMGGNLLNQHWSAKGFTGLRRLFGVRFKLLIALGAEVAGTVFYGLLSKALPPGPVAASLRELSGDEEVHLAFQSELFGMFSRSPALYWVIQAAWFACSLGVTALVFWDHAHTLAALGVRRSETLRQLWTLSMDVGHRIRKARWNSQSRKLVNWRSTFT